MQYIPRIICAVYPREKVPWQFSLNQNKFLVIIIIQWQYAVSQKENLAIWWPSSAGRRLPLSSSIIIPQHNVTHHNTTIPQYHTSTMPPQYHQCSPILTTQWTPSNHLHPWVGQILWQARVLAVLTITRGPLLSSMVLYGIGATILCGLGQRIGSDISQGSRLSLWTSA